MGVFDESIDSYPVSSSRFIEQSGLTIAHLVQ